MFIVEAMDLVLVRWVELTVIVVVVVRLQDRRDLEAVKEDLLVEDLVESTI